MAKAKTLDPSTFKRGDLVKVFGMPGWYKLRSPLTNEYGWWAIKQGYGKFGKVRPIRSSEITKVKPCQTPHRA